jgi:hypothetical protein
MNEEKRLKEIRCSRCRKIKRVPSEWKFKECEFCHARTNRKNEARRKVRKDLTKEIIEGLEGFESAYQNWVKYLKSCGKKPTQKTREQFQLLWMEKQRLNKEKIAKILEHFDSKTAPLQNTNCLRFRHLLEKRNQFLGTTEFANSLSEKDWKLFYNHRCESCSRYSIIHKNGEPNSKTIESETEKDKDYCSRTEFDKGLDEFFGTMKGQVDPYEKGFTKMKDCCLNCGLVLQGGICPSCQGNSASRPDPQQNIGKDDPYLEQLREQAKQQQQEQQRQQGFLDRLRRNPREETK